MRRRFVLILAFLLLASFGPVSAQAEPPVVLRLEGHEGPIACDPTAQQLLCFHTVEGDPATAFVGGEEVQVALTAVPLDGAPGGAPHNLVVALDGDQGDLAGIDSNASNAIAESEVADSGQTVFLQFKVPESGTLYFWCDVGEHEFAGMNFEAEVQPPPDEEDPPADNGTDGDGNGTDGDDGSGADNGTAGPDNGTAPEDGAGMGDGDDTNATDADSNATGEDADAAVSEETPAAPLWSLAALLLGYGALRRRRQGDTP